MTLGVALAGSHGLESLNNWAGVTSCFPVDAVHSIGPVPSSWRRFKFIGEATELPPGSPVVVVSSDVARVMPGSVPLYEFEHPRHAVYVFGADHEILDLPELMGAHRIFVPSTGSELRSHVAGGIVLYDRLNRG